MSVTAHQVLFSHGKFRQQKPFSWKQNKRKYCWRHPSTQFLSGTIFTDFKCQSFSSIWVGTHLNAEELSSRVRKKSLKQSKLKRCCWDSIKSFCCLLHWSWYKISQNLHRDIFSEALFLQGLKLVKLQKSTFLKKNNYHRLISKTVFLVVFSCYLLSTREKQFSSSQVFG